MIHLNNKEKERSRGAEGFHPWIKVRLVLEHLNRRFNKNFNPSSKITVCSDESLVGMKNKTGSVKYINNIIVIRDLVRKKIAGTF